MPVSLPANVSRSWSRIDGIDCLRMLAILYVMLNHIHLRLLFAHVKYTIGMPPQLVSSLVWQGQRGVQIFFVVSGFLITSTALRRWGALRDISIRDFYLIRFARIAPLLLTLLVVLSVLHLAHRPDYTISPKVGTLPQALLAALTFRVGPFEAGHGYLPANWDILWSLGVEEVFYLGFPLACRFVGRNKAALVALLCAFIILGPFARTILTHGNEIWQEYSYLGGMDAIALGCLVAIFLQGRTLSRRMLLAFGLTGAGLLVFCLGFSIQLYKLPIEKLGLGMTLVALGAAMLIIAATQSRWRAPGILSPLLAFGRRSYEIYLTHMFVVFLLFDAFRDHGKPLRLVAPLFLATIAAAGILGELVARFYSEPLNRRLRVRFGDSPARLGSVLAPDPLRTAALQ